MCVAEDKFTLVCFMFIISFVYRSIVDHLGVGFFFIFFISNSSNDIEFCIHLHVKSSSIFEGRKLFVGRITFTLVLTCVAFGFHQGIPFITRTLSLFHSQNVLLLCH